MARTFTAAQWSGTAKLPRGCSMLLNGAISCCVGANCHATYPPSTVAAGRLLPSTSNSPSPSLTGASLTSSNSPAPMANILGNLLNTVGTLVGRSNATGPDTTPDTSPSILDTVLNVGRDVLSAVVPGGPVVNSLATLGDTATNSGTGRATPTFALTDSERTLGFNIEAPSVGTGTAVAVGNKGRRLPPSSKVRRLVNLVGVVNAAGILGLAVPLTAMIAVRPYRRRGISAASLRITRRTIRAVNSINHSLSKIRAHRRR